VISICGRFGKAYCPRIRGRTVCYFDDSVNFYQIAERNTLEDDNFSRVRKAAKVFY